MKIAIVEDEQFWQRKIVEYVKTFFDILEKPQIRLYSTGEEFLAQSEYVDVVFMDVELGSIDGLVVGKEYKHLFPDSLLIILTTHQEWCRKGYQINAFRYLDKANIAEEIKEALGSVKSKLLQQKMVTFHVVSVADMPFRCKDILYIETYKRNLMVHTIENNFECIGKITEYADSMSMFGFFPIHRSYLVNAEWIRGFKRKKVILKNDIEIDMSIYRYQEFQKFFIDWNINQGNG